MPAYSIISFLQNAKNILTPFPGKVALVLKQAHTRSPTQAGCLVSLAFGCPLSKVGPLCLCSSVSALKHAPGRYRWMHFWSGIAEEHAVDNDGREHARSLQSPGH